MFEKEIKFLYDLTITKMKSLGNSFYLSQMQDVGVHPAIIHYISSELDFLIYEDRQKLLKNSSFDYYGEKIDSYFELITEEIKKNKKFQFNLIQKYILNSVAFNVNYVCNPRHTLVKFLFNEQEERKLKEVSLLLNYLYYNDYYKKIILTYLNKKKYITVNKHETSELIKKIDKINLETNYLSIIQQSLTSISDFFNYGKTYKNNVPVSSIEKWFNDKELANSFTQLNKLLKLDGKSVVTINEVLKLLNEKDIINATYEVDLVNLSDTQETEIAKLEDGATTENVTEVFLEQEEYNLEATPEIENALPQEIILEVKLDESSEEVQIENEQKNEDYKPIENEEINNDNDIIEEPTIVEQNDDVLNSENIVQENNYDELYKEIEISNLSQEIKLSDLLADLPDYGIDKQLLEDESEINDEEVKVDSEDDKPLIEDLNDEISYKQEIEQIFPIENEQIETLSENDIVIKNEEPNNDTEEIIKSFDEQDENINENIPYEKKIKILDLSSINAKPDYYISEKKPLEDELQSEINENFIYNEEEIQKEFEAMQKAIIEQPTEDLESISEINKKLISELEKELGDDIFEIQNQAEIMFDNNSLEFNTDSDDENKVLVELSNNIQNDNFTPEIIETKKESKEQNNQDNKIDVNSKQDNLEQYKVTIDESEIDFDSIENEEDLIITNFINENNIETNLKDINVGELENEYEVYDNQLIEKNIEINEPEKDENNIKDISFEIKLDDEIDFEKLDDIDLDEYDKKNEDYKEISEFLNDDVDKSANNEFIDFKLDKNEDIKIDEPKEAESKNQVELKKYELEDELDLESDNSPFNSEEIFKEDLPSPIQASKAKDFKIEIDMIDLLEHRKIPEIIEVMFDYDMEEFSNLIESVQTSDDYVAAEEIIDKYCESHHVKKDSKETIIFKDLIKKYFREG